MKLFHQIIEFLFPPKCVLCKNILEKNELDLCRTCRTEISDHPKPKKHIQFLASWTVLWYYEGNVRQSLLRYKFSNKRSYAGSYGRLLAMKLLREYPEGFDILTWIPISPQRRMQRGYDQVELLCTAVAAELNMEATPTLKKIRNNPPQSGITGSAQRRANVLGVYQCTDPDMIRGKRVLLLDDIITTGSTASEAARVLLTAGAADVTCAAVAAASHSDNSKKHSR